MTNFYDDLERGRAGEKRVAAALIARGHSVEDVSSIPAYQIDDIDFLLSNKNGQHTTLEVKNDIRSNQTGNIFVEETNYNNVRRNNRGWMYYSQAQYFAFVQDQKGVAHIIHHDDLLSLAQSGKYAYKNSCDTKGFIIPIAEIQKTESYFCLEV